MKYNIQCSDGIEFPHEIQEGLNDVELIHGKTQGQHLLFV